MLCRALPNELLLDFWKETTKGSYAKGSVELEVLRAGKEEALKQQATERWAGQRD